MLEAVIVSCVVVILGILFWPRRSPYVRHVTRNRNGLPRWRDQEPY
jgi:hypothetical protein